MSTGTESADWTARHFGEPGATQQTAPSFFMQKSIACRHSEVLVVVLQRVSREDVSSERHHVPKRRCRDLGDRVDERGCSRRTAAGGVRSPTAALAAPIANPSCRRRGATAPGSARVRRPTFGRPAARFMFRVEVGPAGDVRGVPAPAPARIRTASRTESREVAGISEGRIMAIRFIGSPGDRFIGRSVGSPR
jgi:hypothetical protein